MSGGPIIIIRNSVKSTATLNTVTENLTPAECAERDAIVAKDAANWTARDFTKIQALISCAHRRCGKK